MVEAIQFYVDLMNNAGQTESDWYWLQTRAEYLAGNCAMTMWSPFILDEMAGLRDSVLPTCEECADDPAYIARNTGVVSAISGSISSGAAIRLKTRLNASRHDMNYILNAAPTDSSLRRPPDQGSGKPHCIQSRIRRQRDRLHPVTSQSDNIDLNKNRTKGCF